MMTYYDGLQSHQAHIQYTVATGVLAYTDSAGAPQTIDTLPRFHIMDRPVHTVKLVADFTTHEYVRVILDQSVYSLAGIPLLPAVAFVGPRLHSLFGVLGDLATDSTCTIDRVIVTQSEPT